MRARTVTRAATSAVLASLAIWHATADAATYRCPKPDGTLWPGWHSECPAIDVDPNAPKPAPPPPKRCDFGSTGYAAERACAAAIERLAKHTFRWVNTGWEAKFPTQLCASPGSHLILLKGDRIEFQNGFGAWGRYAYECTWNPETSHVMKVDAAPW